MRCTASRDQILKGCFDSFADVDDGKR